MKDYNEVPHTECYVGTPLGSLYGKFILVRASTILTPIVTASGLLEIHASRFPVLFYLWKIEADVKPGIVLGCCIATWIG